MRISKQKSYRKIDECDFFGRVHVLCIRRVGITGKYDISHDALVMFCLQSTVFELQFRIFVIWIVFGVGLLV